MRIQHLAYLPFLLFLLFSCETIDDNNDEQPKPNEEDEKEISAINQFVYDYMREDYLWYDELPSSPKLTYYEPEDLVNELIYKEKDRWTYIMKDPSAEDAAARTNDDDLPDDIGTGVFPGGDGTSYYVVLVASGSKAHEQGVRRGDKILKVNGATPTESNVTELYTTEVGKSFTLELEPIEGEVFTATFECEILDIPYVGEVTVKELSNGKKVGYFFYESFEKNSEEPLNEAFQQFKDEGVTDLIIDLRYNGGGYLDICQQIGSLCYDKAGSSDVFLKLVGNDNSDNNEDTIPFRNDLAAALNVNSIVFITTQFSASASEALINGLKPYVNDVKIVGGQSHGKYVGSVVLNEEGYFFFPITFKVANVDGVSDYEDGLMPDLNAEQFNYVNVALTNEEIGLYAYSLFYLENNYWPTLDDRGVILDYQTASVSRRQTEKSYKVASAKFPKRKQQFIR
ncbi:S41 family peptidase [Sediminitomix flava]|uniref:C-terminal processing protease CtpA/Prc n=1 Tax=Sediminitomix flava TaxID=379075 RepID=A0A315ZB40_SEDFL|nr:S41 family peptidase [Sediminitomix flava]PWJ42795.1 C-terminal processing protease CtpA/Prc [Sediminitomix flava]